MGKFVLQKRNARYTSNKEQKRSHLKMLFLKCLYGMS